MEHSLLRLRLKTLRERLSLTQDALASQMDLPDRQALSEIESGGRKISPAELAKAAKALGTTVFDLSDPLKLVGEGQFSWRQNGVELSQLDEYEAKAGRWIAAFRFLSHAKGEPINSGLLQISITESSTFEDAQMQGEDIASVLELGDIPAQRLANALEKKLETLVLYVDAIPGVSGAACQTGVLNTIFVNRKEPAARRNFDLAHEFFHLLTWHTMPPRRIDEANSNDKKYRRVERLADNFAAGLLMPSNTIKMFIERNPIPKEVDLPAWIIRCASLMEVSPTAMTYRLLNLGHITQAAQTRLTNSGGLAGASIIKTMSEITPPLFSGRLLNIVGWAIDNGEISIQRASKLFDVTIEGLAELFEQQKIDCRFAL